MVITLRRHALHRRAKDREGTASAEMLYRGGEGDENHGYGGHDMLDGGPRADRFVVSSGDKGIELIRDCDTGDLFVLRTEEGTDLWPSVSDTIASGEAVGTRS